MATIKELTNGLGAHSVVEAVGTQESMMQAIHSTRPGGHVGFVGVAHDVAIAGMDLFWSLAGVHGGPAPVRRFLPELIDLIWNREIDPGKVFDLELPLDRPPPATRRWTSASDQGPPAAITSPTAQRKRADMHITRNTVDTQKGPADWFSGDVYAAGPPGSRSVVLRRVRRLRPLARGGGPSPTAAWR